MGLNSNMIYLLPSILTKSKQAYHTNLRNSSPLVVISLFMNRSRKLKHLALYESLILATLRVFASRYDYLALYESLILATLRVFALRYDYLALYESLDRRKR
ncbi:Uncharacterized protein LB4E_1625 [Leptospira borgpetersenii str. 4E]|nr:Uncharacterized protein LB4E_1625 [Leptospira borgpetersenii str. 4E]